MAYKKQNFTSGQTLKAEHLNYIENGILENEANVDKKQDILTSGENIKTINGKSILGSGDIVIEGSEGSFIRDYDFSVKSVNHRGFNSIAPENTIPAYILSSEKGYKYVEADVEFTSDNVPVLLHDATIDRTSNGSGKINQMTYAQVLNYDFGSWKSAEYAGTKIPTFKEFIILCKRLGLHPYIELKSSGAYTEAQIQSIVDIVYSVGMKGKVTYISFDSTFLTYVKNYDPYARLGYLVKRTGGFNSTDVSTAVKLRTDTNEVFLDARHMAGYEDVTDKQVQLCINANLPLEVWSINDEELVKSMPHYISGVTTDDIIAGKILYENCYVSESFIPATSITLSSSTLTIDGETSQTLTATVLPTNTTQVVSWTSSNITVATVSNGVVTAKSNGDAIITATIGNYSATCAVTVTGIENDDPIIIPDAPEGWEGVRYLTNDDIMYGVSGSSTADQVDGVPYTKTNSKRAGYFIADIPVESGYTYKVSFESKYNTAQVGLQALNTIGYEYYNNFIEGDSSRTITDHLYDSGWQENGVEHEFPETHGGYPLVALRLAFRNSTSNPTMASGDIISVTIIRKKIEDPVEPDTPETPDEPDTPVDNPILYEFTGSDFTQGAIMQTGTEAQPTPYIKTGTMTRCCIANTLDLTIEGGTSVQIIAKRTDGTALNGAIQSFGEDGVAAFNAGESMQPYITDSTWKTESDVWTIPEDDTHFWIVLKNTSNSNLKPSSVGTVQIIRVDN